MGQQPAGTYLTPPLPYSEMRNLPLPMAGVSSAYGGLHQENYAVLPTSSAQPSQPPMPNIQSVQSVQSVQNVSSVPSLPNGTDATAPVQHADPAGGARADLPSPDAAGRRPVAQARAAGGGRRAAVRLPAERVRQAVRLEAGAAPPPGGAHGEREAVPVRAARLQRMLHHRLGAVQAPADARGEPAAVPLRLQRVQQGVPHEARAAPAPAEHPHAQQAVRVQGVGLASGCERRCGKAFVRQSDCTLHENRNHRSLKPFRCIYPGCNRCYATKYELSRHVHTHGSFDILRVCGNKERRQTHIGLRTCTFHNTLKTHDTRCPSNNGTPVRTTGEENEEVAHSRQYQRHASGSPAFLHCIGTAASAPIRSATASDYGSIPPAITTSFRVTTFSFLSASFRSMDGFVIKSVLFPTSMTGTGRLLSFQ